MNQEKVEKLKKIVQKLVDLTSDIKISKYG